MKVLILDDHGLIRDALRAVLHEVAPGADILEAADHHSAAPLIATDSGIGLVLLDLTLPDADGFALLQEWRARYPSVSIVVLSAMRDRQTVLRALDLGAMGFIPKSANREVMLGALRLVLAGGIYVPPEALARGMEADAPPQAAREPELTARQWDVLALMMEGRSNKWICRALDLAEPTVKHHVTAILRALNASNRTEAVLAATALKLDRRRIRSP